MHGVAAKQIEDYGPLLKRVGSTRLWGAIRISSGGQRARIGIARALAVSLSSWCATKRGSARRVDPGEVLNFSWICAISFSLPIFISYDLGVVRHLSNRVVVMYLGRVVEIAATESLFAAPNHPYTQALLSEVPRIDRRRRAFVPIKGEIPSPLAPPSGCHFHPRCPYAMPRCSTEVPPLREIAPARWSACHLNDVRTVSCNEHVTFRLHGPAAAVHWG